MTRLIFFILTFGFVVQCTGAAVYVKQTAVKTEQCPDDNQPGEETKKGEFKKDKDQIGISLINEVTSGRIIYMLPECKQYYPPGFYSKPFLPPR